MEGLQEMGYYTHHLTGLKKSRGGCHTLSVGLEKLLLQAESITHELHPARTEKGTAEAGFELGLIYHPPNSTLMGLNAQIHSRALPAQMCPAETAKSCLLQPDVAHGPFTSTTTLSAKVAGAP